MIRTSDVFTHRVRFDGMFNTIDDIENNYVSLFDKILTLKDCDIFLSHDIQVINKDGIYVRYTDEGYVMSLNQSQSGYVMQKLKKDIEILKKGLESKEYRRVLMFSTLGVINDTKKGEGKISINETGDFTND